MKALRRGLVVVGALIAVLVVLPFLIPLGQDGVPAASLVTDPDGAFITLQGINIYYEDKGPSDAPVVLLLHGLFGSTGSWRYNVEVLLAAGYRVIAFDRPGFGLSDKVEAFNYAVSNQADLTAQLMDALDVETATIIAHSAGGNVAAQLALRHPERVERLIMAAPAVISGGAPPFVGAIVAFPPVWRWAQIGLRAAFTRSTLENTLRGLYADSSFLTEADIDVYWRAFQTNGWDVALLALTRDGAGGGLREADLQRITAPVTLLWGAQDTITPLEQGQRLLELLPHSRIIIWPTLGHQPFEEAPDVFNSALLEVLAAEQPPA